MEPTSHPGLPPLPADFPHTLTPMSRALRFLTLFALALSVAACDSSGPEPEPEPEPSAPDPAFQVPSVPQSFADGTPGLQFFAIPNRDVEISSVDIRNPVGDGFRFNAGNALVLQGERILIHDPDFIFFRVSGQWRFTFNGVNDAGSGERYSVVQTVDVSARTRN